MIEVVRFRQVGRVVDDVLLAVFGEGVVAHVGNGGDDRHIKFPLQALLDDFHVEHPQESAAESESEGGRRFWFKYQRCIVELELLHGGTQLLIVFGVDGVDAGKNHRLDVFKPFHPVLTGVFFERDGVTHLDFTGVFDAGNDVAYVARRHLFAGLQVHPEHPNLVGLVFAVGCEELHLIPFFQSAVEDAVVRDDASERIVDAVENHGLQRGFRIALGCRYARYDGFEDVLDAQSRLATGGYDVVHGTADEVHNLIANYFGIGGVQIHLIEDWNDF